MLVGSGTKVPRIQDVLVKGLKSTLGWSLNTDEAVALGAAYKAAELRDGFKVNTFITKDAILFPIEVSLFISYDTPCSTLKEFQYLFINVFYIVNIK